MALGEDDVEDLHHRLQAIVERSPGRRQLEADVGLPQARLGPADPLGDCRLGNEERTGDLRRRQATDGAQRQGDLTRPGKGAVAAKHEEREAVVAIRHG